MNKIGVRGHDFGRMSIEDLPRSIKEKGFDAIHFAPTKAINDVLKFDDITTEVLELCKESFVKNNVEIDVYGCYVEIGMLDKAKRLEEVERFKKGISHCKTVGARVVGTETTHFPLGGENRAEAYEAVKDSVLRMVEEAERLNVNIAVEPVALHSLDSPELTKKLLDEVKSDKLKVIIDSVNLFTVENIHNHKQIITDCFELFGDKICTMHIKDVTLIGDQDRSTIKMVNDTFKWECIGDGIIDYRHILSYVKGKDINLLREGSTLEGYKRDIEGIKAALKLIV